jgi:hypothetical protein
MSEFSDNPPIFNYVVSVGNREYIITILKDGMSQWDDLSLGNLGDRIADVGIGSVVEVRLSDEIYAMGRAMAEKEMAEEARTGQSPIEDLAADVVQMDKMLMHFYWLHVNPLYPEPLIQLPSRAHS